MRGRRALPALLALLLPLLVGLGAAPAGATTYAYWSYWHKAPGSSTWTYSNSGPYYYRPADGSVEGWHFVSGSGGPSDPPPRASGSYAGFCSTPPSKAGVQVALIIDFGSSVQKACLTVPTGSSGSTVLTKAGTNPHYNSSGLLCSIEGYPKSGCGQVVSSPAPTPAAASTAPQAAPTHGTTTGTGSSSGRHPASATTTAAGVTASASSAAATTAAARRVATSKRASAAAKTAAARQQAALAASTDAAQPSLAPVAAHRGGQQSSPLGLVAGGLVIAALGVGAMLRARRRT